MPDYLEDYTQYLDKLISAEQQRYSEALFEGESSLHSKLALLLYEIKQSLQTAQTYINNKIDEFKKMIENKNKLVLSNLQNKLDETKESNRVNYEDKISQLNQILDNQKLNVGNIIGELEKTNHDLKTTINNNYNTTKELNTKLSESTNNNNNNYYSTINESNNEYNILISNNLNELNNNILKLNQLIDNEKINIINNKMLHENNVKKEYDEFKNRELNRRENQINEVNLDTNSKLNELINKRKSLLSQAESEIINKITNYINSTNSDLEKDRDLLDQLENTLTKENKKLLAKLENDKILKVQEVTNDINTDIINTYNTIQTLEIELMKQINVSKNNYKKLLKYENIVNKYKIGLNEESKRRLDLACEILDLKGNIRVYCRVRPILQLEIDSGLSFNCISFPVEGDLAIRKEPVQLPDHFHFDEIFPPNSTQDQIFYEVLPYIQKLLDGFDVCIFAYGQTGSGKTYTMEGPKNDPGVNIRSLKALFSLAKDRSRIYKYKFSISIFEVYNDEVLDLLSQELKRVSDVFDNNDSSLQINTNLKSKNKVKLRVNNKGTLLFQNCKKVSIRSFEEALFYMDKGHSNRFEASHLLNEHSSRSHLIVSISISGKHIENGNKVKGKLNLVDLAGSERVNKTEAAGIRLEEAKHINKSLSSLGNVIKSIGDIKSTHIPYRDSKLTRLLSTSLTSKSKVLMFVNVSPALYNYNETISSLQFATRCRKTDLSKDKE